MGGQIMCHKCNALRREIEGLKAGTAVLRANNIKLAVENNNLRAVVGAKMQPVSLGYLVEWERKRRCGMMDMTVDDYGCAETYSRGLAFLKQDGGHAKKIKEHQAREARYEAAMERAAQVLIDGDEIERAAIAKQIEALLDQQGDAA